MWILSIVIFAAGTSGLVMIEEKQITKEFKTEQDCKVALKQYVDSADDKKINFLARCMAKEQYDQIKKK